MEKSLEEPENGNPSSPLSSSSSDDDEAAEDLQIQTLEKSLAENPFEYGTYVQYIQCLRKYGHLEKLRQARESMNQRFPLSPEMWQEWIKDEISLCSSVEAFTEVEKLYERAVQEYLSVSLWCDYINFVQENDASISQCSPDGVSKMRKLLERAVAAAGLIVTEGNKIWEAYREFEQALCLTIKDSQNEEKEKQNDIVRKLYHRQLSLPLVDLRATLRDYKLWEAEQGHDNDANSDFDGVPQHVVSAYRKATELYNFRKQYEEEIMKTDASDTERLQQFLNYIKFEESSGDPVRIQILYERAVSRFPVSSDLWLGYTSYLDQNLKVPTILRSVYSRATRNCTWVGELWVRYLLSLERMHATEKELSDVFEQAVQCAFTSFKEYLDLFLTRVDGLRRRMSLAEAKKDGLDYTIIRETLQRATEYLSPDCLSTDELLCLHSYWARLEVSLGKDIGAACGVWENLLKKRGTMLEVWQSYITMELELGQINEARSIYRRCYTKRFSGTGSEDICYSWLRFERENGTLEDYDTAQKKVAPRLKELKAFRAQQEAKSDNASLVKQDNPTAVDTSRKRKIGKVSESKPPPEKRKKYSSEPSETSEKVPAKATDQINIAKETDEGETNNLLDTTSKQSVRTSEHRDSKPELYNDKCTAFISNLSFEANEEHLRKFFKDSGGVVAIRLLKDKITRQSRGLAYIDFSDDEHLAAAVAKNKQKLLGKKLSIARSDPKRSQKRDSASSNSSTTHKIPFGSKMTRGNSDKKDVSAAFVVAKHGGKEFTGSVTFAVPRALAQRLEHTPKDAKPDQASEQPKSND
ncbi:squamous cell carcinoma antigen recognized by T-cells 3-like isoform X1 [Zingiber officinale]|uniref:squamous cell carcinoma antigen recognized by T-cells 3-like isoform X1 n=1 Tax=Zingiber officinale TaxID=94328 RepID=UPI001C4B839B|nr:squamous cell carcinoma antigen recognized by T-cells 3-like isoform X1 [Zingiber officinale]